MRGLDLVHLQCHFGLDTLPFARVGARVTGLDFSAQAIAKARELARTTGLEDVARFVEGDVLHAAEVLAPETFDVVFVSLGALCWLPSVGQWAEQVSALLRPGGRLYIHDVHPLAWALADDEPRLAHSYFEEADPYVADDDGSYADGDGRVEHTRHYEWNHSLGEIITAVLEAGLRLDRLTEHDWTVSPHYPWLIETSPHQWTTPPGVPRMPLTFTLLASKPRP